MPSAEPPRRRSRDCGRDLETAYDSRPATHRGGAGVARAARDGRRRGRGARRQDPGRRFGERNRCRERIGILGGSPRPPMPRPCWTSSRSSFRGARSPTAPGGSSDLPGLRGIPTLRELAALEAQLLRGDRTGRARGRVARGSRGQDDRFRVAIEASRRAALRMAEIERLVQQCDALARMEYGFLYDPARHLLAIGYNVGERRRDPSYYDLLASEARFASFVAIAQGQLPQENWFALGRLLTVVRRPAVLLSWSGSMFEYLMPLLVMPTYDNTLLDRTARVSVAAPDRVRKAARRALGHFGMRLQLGRREPQLPIPRVRRARAWD